MTEADELGGGWGGSNRRLEAHAPVGLAGFPRTIASQCALELVDGDGSPDNLVGVATTRLLDASGEVGLGGVGLDGGDPGLNEHLGLQALHLRQAALV